MSKGPQAAKKSSGIFGHVLRGAQPGKHFGVADVIGWGKSNMNKALTSTEQAAVTALSPVPLTVMVPFYKNPHLVAPLFRSIRACRDELRALNARLVFYNDSPGDEGLRAELKKALAEADGLALSVVENETNLGFVATVNVAFDTLIAQGGDIVLLNSDTVVFPGVFRELAAVAYSDPMIGFVSPRSNNATLATFPHGADKLELTPAEHYARFRALTHLLPRVSYTPAAIGFCLYVKGQILRDFGGFDAAYGKGYNEENDLICRANEYGYRAALANHAFTWHQGEQSFGVLDEGKAVRDAENAKLLNSRYPDYLPRVWSYFDSPEYLAERILGGLAPGEGYRFSIGFDFSHFGAYHNGTFEAGKRLLEAAAQTWPKDVEIVVLCGREVFEFHQMEEGGRVRWRASHDANVQLSAVVRMGQIYDRDSLFRLLLRAPVVAVFMLDTISVDCGYLSVELEHNLWSFVMKWSDVVFGISQFTVDQLRRRFLVGDRAQLLPVLLSVAPEEYAPDAGRTFDEAQARSGPPRNLLVIGNKFKHKGMDLAVKALAHGLPETHIVALGLKASDHPNVEAIGSGDLSDERIDELYRQADAVVFPTHYEGFGFPLMHALARRRPIYVRRLPVFEEIAGRFSIGQENVRWYADDRELVELLKGPFEGWRGPPPAAETDGWKRCADDVYAALQKSLQAVSHPLVVDRLRWLLAAFPRPQRPVPTPIEPPAEAPPPTPSLGGGGSGDEAEQVAEFVSYHTRQLLLGICRNRTLYVGLRRLWRLVRYGRVTS
jgi:GT2 family glycosyltransferase